MFGQGMIASFSRSSSSEPALSSLIRFERAAASARNIFLLAADAETAGTSLAAADRAE